MRKKSIQIFTRPTHNRIAEYILSQDEFVRIDAFRAFTGIFSISSAKQLDQHFNRFDSYSNLRKLVNDPSSGTLFDSIRKASEINVLLDGKSNKNAATILKNFSNCYDDMINVFPFKKKGQSVDFLCATDFGYVIIEFQIARNGFFDKRALAYLASIYGNQLDRSEGYSDIEDFVGINLIGDGKTSYFKDGNFVRDYNLIDKKNLKN